MNNAIEIWGSSSLCSPLKNFLNKVSCLLKFGHAIWFRVWNWHKLKDQHSLDTLLKYGTALRNLTWVTATSINILWWRNALRSWIWRSSGVLQGMAARIAKSRAHGCMIPSFSLPFPPPSPPHVSSSTGRGGNMEGALAAIWGTTQVLARNPKGRFPNCKCQREVRSFLDMQWQIEHSTACRPIYILRIPIVTSELPYLISLYKGFHQIIICLQWPEIQKN